MLRLSSRCLVCIAEPSRSMLLRIYVFVHQYPMGSDFTQAYLAPSAMRNWCAGFKSSLTNSGWRKVGVAGRQYSCLWPRRWLATTSTIRKRESPRANFLLLPRRILDADGTIDKDHQSHDSHQYPDFLQRVAQRYIRADSEYNAVQPLRPWLSLSLK